jgi:hypothetical protein
VLVSYRFHGSVLQATSYAGTFIKLALFNVLAKTVHMGRGADIEARLNGPDGFAAFIDIIASNP